MVSCISQKPFFLACGNSSADRRPSSWQSLAAGRQGYLDEMRTRLRERAP